VCGLAMVTRTVVCLGKLVKLCAATAVATALPVGSAPGVGTSATVEWSSVGIGGGGFTSGVIPTARSAVGTPTVCVKCERHPGMPPH
jgi:hypothetical protein